MILYYKCGEDGVKFYFGDEWVTLENEKVEMIIEKELDIVDKGDYLYSVSVDTTDVESVESVVIS